MHGYVIYLFSLYVVCNPIFTDLATNLHGNLNSSIRSIFIYSGQVECTHIPIFFLCVLMHHIASNWYCDRYFRCIVLGFIFLIIRTIQCYANCFISSWIFNTVLEHLMANGIQILQPADEFLFRKLLSDFLEQTIFLFSSHCVSKYSLLVVVNRFPFLINVQLTGC